MHKKYEQIAYDEASQSVCQERQVGAVLVEPVQGIIWGQGHNYSTSCICNDRDWDPQIKDMECPKNVIHAEIAALNNVHTHAECDDNLRDRIFVMYVTQPPCNNCLNSITQFEKLYDCIITIHVCEQFLKFDDDKDRFDLIPPEWDFVLAKILTYGAKRYKPNNWRKGEINRYVGAVMRHWNAYRRGERIDKHSGRPHLWLMMTNVGFLITLTEEEKDYEEHT